MSIVSMIHWRSWTGMMVVTAALSSAMAGPTTQPSAATTQPQAAATTEPSPQVQTLVQELGSDLFTHRDAAQKKLIEMADDVEPQLRGALKLDLSDEARQRILAILHKIEENRELGPSVITLHYHDAPLIDVLDDFARQSSADLGVHRPQIIEYAKSRRISLDLDHVNFWEALRQISERSGLGPQPYSNNTRMTLEINGGAGFDMFGDHMVVSGPVAITPQQCQLTRTVMFNRGGGANSNFSLMLCAVVEPKLKVISGENMGWLKECVDDKKHNLAPDGRQGAFFYNNTRQWLWQLQTNLREVPDMGGKIASLKGSLKFAVQIKSETIEINDVLKAKNVTRNVGNNVVTFQQMTQLNQQYQVHLTLTTSNSAAWEQIQALTAGMQLLDDRDEPMQQNGMQTNGNPGHFDITLMYSSGGFNNQINGPGQINGPSQPKKLTWEVPTEVKEITVPFEIRDLDLPHAPTN